MADLAAVLQISADTTGVEAGLAQVKRSIAGVGTSAVAAGKQAGDGLEEIGKGGTRAAPRVEASTNNIISQIQRTTAVLQAGERGSRAYYEALAPQRGVDLAALKPYLDQLEAVKKSQQQTTAALAAAPVAIKNIGVSAGQTTQALRQLPAQFSDIVVSLQGGQRPLSILLQQGSQIKDSFGGIGPALRAVGGALLGLINPLTIAALAVGGLGFAYFKGSQEAQEYSKAIILSGNAAGTTASQLQGYAQSIGKITGSQAGAAEALAQFTLGGKVGAENLEQFTRAAVRFEAVTGQAVSKTVEQFAALAKDPVDASVKLNDQYNFLTASVYKQIKALEDQGKTTEAANLAQKTFADTIENRTAQIVQNIGYIEAAWLGVKKQVLGVIDATLNVGRAPTLKDQTDQKRADIDNLNKLLAPGSTGIGASDPATIARRQKLLETAKEELSLLTEQERLLKRGAEATAKRAEQEKLAIEFSQDGNKYKSDALKLQQEITQAETKGRELVQAGLITEKQLQERIADIRLSKNKSGGAKPGESEIAALKAQTDAVIENILRLQEQNDETRKLSSGEQAALKIKQELTTSITGQARAQKILALAAAENLAGFQKIEQAEQDRVKALKASQAELLKQIESSDRLAQSVLQQALEQEAANLVFGKGKTAIEELRLAQARLQLQEAESSDNFDPKYIASLASKTAAQERYVASLKAADFKDLNNRQIEFTRSVEEEVALFAQEANLSGLTSLERDKIAATRAVELDLAKRIAEVDRSSLSDAEKQTLRTDLQAAAAQKSALEVGKVIRADFDKTADSINQSLTQGILSAGTDGGKGLRKALQDQFINNPIKVVLQAALSPLSQSLAGSLTGSAQGALGAVSSGGSALGGLSSLGSLGSAFGNNFATGFSSIFTEGFGGISSALEVGLGNIAVGTTTSITSGLGAIVGAAGPYAIAGIAAYQLATKLFQQQGGPKQDGRAGVLFSGIGQADNSLGSAVKPILDSLQGQYDQLNKILGGSGGVQFGLGVSRDPKGTSATFVEASASRNGQQLFTNLNRNVGRSPEEATATLKIAAEDALIGALRASNLRAEFVAVLDSAQANEGKLAQLNLLGQLDTIFKTLGGRISSLGGLSLGATEYLNGLLGGIDNLQSSIGSYYQNFYSQEERRAQTQVEITQQLAAVGQTLPATREQFRALFDAVAAGGDTTTLAVLLKVQSAFAEITPVAADLAATLSRSAKDIADNLANLAAEGERLQIELLRAKGQNTPADFAQRDLNIKGFTAAEIAAYDYNQTIRDQITQFSNAKTAAEALANSIKGLEGQQTTAQIRLLRAQGRGTEADAAQRSQDLSGFATAAEVNLYDFIKSLDALSTELESATAKAQEIAATRKSIEADLFNLTATTAEARQKEIDALAPSLQSLKASYFARLDEKTAIDRITASLAKFASEGENLQVQLLRAQGNGAGADALQRSLDIRGLTDLEIAAYDANAATRALIQRISDAAAITDKLTQATKDYYASISDGLQKTLDQAKAGTTDAFSGLQRSVNAQKQLAEISRQTALEQVNLVKGVLTTSRDAARNLYSQVGGTKDQAAAQGKDFIAQALLTAKATGYLPEQDKLAQAIQAANADQVYATQQDADFQRLVLAGQLAELGDLADGQLTEAQRLLKVQETELSRLDGILSAAQAQLDAINGVNTSILTIPLALQNFATALSAQQAAQAAVASNAARVSVPLASGGDATARLINNAYQNELGRNADPAGAAEFRRILNEGVLGLPELIASLRNSDEARARDALLGIPGFASGGSFSGGIRLVGERGPELEVTGPSRIYSASETASLLRSGGSQGNELLVEMRALRLEVAALRAAADATAASTASTANAANGRPDRPMPVLVQPS